MLRLFKSKKKTAQARILLVDDEPDLVSTIQCRLEQCNCEVITAGNGKEGLEKAVNEKPDLILLDIMMPKKSGMRTYTELKKDPDLKSVPVIIITGISDEIDYKTLLDRSVTGRIPPEGHLTKPCKPDVLIDEIRKILG